MTDQQFKELLTQISGINEGQKRLVEQVGGLSESQGKLAEHMDSLAEHQIRLTQVLEDQAAEQAKHRKEIRDLNRAFVKLFQHMEEGFADVHAELATKASASQVDSLYQLVDSFIKRLETEEHERLAIANHQDRQDGWIAQLAGQTHTKLVPEM